MSKATWKLSVGEQIDLRESVLLKTYKSLRGIMAKKPETRLQQRIQKKLKAEVGGKWFKVHGSAFQEAGQPDLIGCVDGRFFGFEVKIPGKGKVSAIQAETLKEWRREGGIACVVESPEEAVTLVKAVTSSPDLRLRGNRLHRWLRSFI